MTSDKREKSISFVAHYASLGKLGTGSQDDVIPSLSRDLLFVRV